MIKSDSAVIVKGRVIPDYAILDNLHNPLTEGEWTLLRFLDQHLSKDPRGIDDKNLDQYDGWLIFVQPYLNGTRPDIIAFKPSVGAIIYEVKDWDLKNYAWREGLADSREFVVTDSKGTYPIKSPDAQVSYYKEKIVGQLIPQIGEKIDQEKKSYGAIKTALYFHKATTEEARKLFQHKPYSPVFGYNELTESKLNEINPDAIRPNSKYWEASWNKVLLYWLGPPLHSLEQTQLLNLSKKQQELAEPAQGHYRVRGVAGSGKTQILAYRAAKLASMGKKVLILTFNITLWHYIHDLVRRAPFVFDPTKIMYDHFHGFCFDVLNKSGAASSGSLKSITESEEDKARFFRDTLPNRVSKALDDDKGNGELDDYKFDAILIDEGQDFYVEWYFLLCRFLSDRDEFVVVCDKKQNIYGRDLSWIDKRRVGLEKFGDWNDLTVIFRLPAKIAEISNSFSEMFNLDQELKSDKNDNIVLPGFAPLFIWKNVDAMSVSWLDEIYKAFDTLKKNNPSIRASDTVILLPSHELGLQCVEFFRKKNIAVDHVFSDDDDFKTHKRSFWPGGGGLKMSTIYSFKGWEAYNVIIFLPENSPQKSEEMDMGLYTALTRTRQNLYIVNENVRYWSFGEGVS
ncbi:MAG: UvrD-helicase domain-containing protein [Patescibacteria group bacterium]